MLPSSGSISGTAATTDYTRGHQSRQELVSGSGRASQLVELQVRHGGFQKSHRLRLTPVARRGQSHQLLPQLRQPLRRSWRPQRIGLIHHLVAVQWKLRALTPTGVGDESALTNSLPVMELRD